MYILLCEVIIPSSIPVHTSCIIQYMNRNPILVISVTQEVILLKLVSAGSCPMVSFYGSVKQCQNYTPTLSSVQ